MRFIPVGALSHLCQNIMPLPLSFTKHRYRFRNLYRLNSGIPKAIHLQHRRPQSFLYAYLRFRCRVETKTNGDFERIAGLVGSLIAISEDVSLFHYKISLKYCIYVSVHANFYVQSTVCYLAEHYCCE